jgi:hypothetical protein
MRWTALAFSLVLASLAVAREASAQYYAPAPQPGVSYGVTQPGGSYGAVQQPAGGYGTAQPAGGYAAPGQPMAAPPPEPVYFLHEGLYNQLRVGAGWALQTRFSGVGFGPMIDWGIGFTSRIGLAAGVNVGMSYHGTPNFGLFDVWAGPQIRYTALPRSLIHPFGEFGFFFHLPIDTHNPGPPLTMDQAVRVQIGYGAQLSGGVQFDLTPRLSLDLGLRFELFANAAQATNTVYFVFGPYIGIVAFR